MQPESKKRKTSSPDGEETPPTSSSSKKGDELSFKDEVVIVTGASTGIGKACAVYFHERGAVVYNIDIVTPPDSDYPSAIRTRLADLSDVKKLQSTFASILEETKGVVDHLIANAGIHLFQDIENTTVEQFDQVVNVNLRGVFFSIQSVIGTMKKQKRGSIVTIGSDQSFIGKAFSAVYGCTKAGIAQITKSTAVQYAANGIRVNCVCPGTIETPLYHNAVAKYCKLTGTTPEDAYKGLATAQPIPRVGQPHEVAFVVGFVSKSEFMTGAQISVDGGYVAT